MFKKLASNATHLFKQHRFSIGLSNITRCQSTDYSSKCDGLDIKLKEQTLWITLDRPAKFNALTREMYVQLTETFNTVNQDKSVKAVLLTGNGEYYSSGNDLTNFTRAMQHEGGYKAGLTESSEILYKFVNSLIDLEKLLIAAVNGPAVGIPVTTLPLFDYVLASTNATFQTPFTALGQCPEACSSITLPQIMGFSRASELLLLNMTWDARKAQTYGLVSEVVEHDQFRKHLENMLYSKRGLIATCYPKSTQVSKSLIRGPQIKQMLVETNRRECNAILDLWLGDECADALQKFMNRSKK